LLKPASHFSDSRWAALGRASSYVADKAVIQAIQSTNVGNLCDTSLSTGPTSPSAQADDWSSAKD